MTPVALLHQNRPNFVFEERTVIRRDGFCTPRSRRTAKNQAKDKLRVQNVGAEIHIFRSIRLEEHNAVVKAQNR